MDRRGLNMKHTKIRQTHLIPTLQKHITTKHSNIMNVVVMYILFSTEWQTLQWCYFWRGMKTYFSSLLMMLISSQSKTCKWNVWRQLSKLFYGGGKGAAQRVCIRDSAQLVTSPDFVSMLTSIWLVTSSHRTIYFWCYHWTNFEKICFHYSDLL